MNQPFVYLNETHDLSLVSWLTSANGHNDFPIQNLPFGVFTKPGTQQQPHCGVAIGDQVIDMHRLWSEGIFTGLAEEANKALMAENLNPFMSMGNEAASAIRLSLSKALRQGSIHQNSVNRALIPMTQVTMLMPCEIGDYSDFYSSIHHATAVGKLFRPQNPLLPNYKWLPIGYHGRASSICVSGEPVFRPQGQVKPDSDMSPVLKPTSRLDYEVELGMFIGKPVSPCNPTEIDSADQHFFGVCLLNDWSARDIQAWEYQPLGPFLSKNFMSSISPWIVSADALVPFRTCMQRTPEDEQTIDYLSSAQNTQKGAIDIHIQCYITTSQMRAEKRPPQKLSETSFKHAFWTVAQMITHHTTSGCGLNAGDLLGSGTQSGPEPQEAGSLLELSEGGKHKIQLDNGEQRTFLEDGDEIELRGFCKHSSGLRIGLGSVNSRVFTSQSPQTKSDTNGHFSQ